MILQGEQKLTTQTKIKTKNNLLMKNSFYFLAKISGKSLRQRNLLEREVYNIAGKKINIVWNVTSMTDVAWEVMENFFFLLR